MGEETDIVSKEMFAWEDRARAQSEKGQWLALRPENTAGVVRAYIEHKLWERPGLQRFYYIGPQFRRERPQKGRYRQFYQIGAEVIGPSAAGSESPAVDAELLEMLATLLDRLGIQGWSLNLTRWAAPMTGQFICRLCVMRSKTLSTPCAQTASAARRQILCACWIAKFLKTSRSLKSFLAWPTTWMRVAARTLLKCRNS